MDNRAIERKISEIIQAPELRTLTSLHSKTKNIQISVQINGNDAIDRVCADDGDIRAAMRHILSVLPEPRMRNLKILAMMVALESEGNNIRDAAKSLGITFEPYYRWGIKRLNEEGIIGNSKAEDPGGLPSG